MLFDGRGRNHAAPTWPSDGSIKSWRGCPEASDLFVAEFAFGLEPILQGGLFGTAAFEKNVIGSLCNLFAGNFGFGVGFNGGFNDSFCISRGLVQFGLNSLANCFGYDSLLDVSICYRWEE